MEMLGSKLMWCLKLRLFKLCLPRLGFMNLRLWLYLWLIKWCLMRSRFLLWNCLNLRLNFLFNLIFIKFYLCFLFDL